MIGMLPGTRADRELWSHRARVSVGYLLPPVNQSWSKFAQSLGKCFRVSPPIGAHDDVQVLSHLYHRGALLQVWCPVQFRGRDVTSDTHRCYRRRGGLVPYALVCQPPSQVQYMLCISKKRFFSGRTEPAFGRIASGLCIRSSRISCAFCAFHFLRLVHPDAPLSLHSVRRASCGPTPSSCLPLVCAPLSSHLLASFLLLVVARIRRPFLVPSHPWRPRSFRFHPPPSAGILCTFFLSLHPTVTSIIPLLFTRRLARPPCRPPTLVGFPSQRRT